MRTLLRSTDHGRTLVVAASERSDGDVHPHRVRPDVLRERQVVATGRPWVLVDQVHGTDVHRHRVDDDGTEIPLETPPLSSRVTADVLVATRASVPALAVWAADCATIALVGDGGTMVLVHAGWRGLAAGVVDVAVDTFEAQVEAVVHAVLGPVIHPCCYAFGADDAAAVARGVGADIDDVVAAGGGHLALDVPAAVAAALTRRDVTLDVVGPCTGCDARWFSHRVRRDSGRHALVAWFEDGDVG